MADLTTLVAATRRAQHQDGVKRKAITLNSGGAKRDARLNPIVARVKEQLVALAATHANRPGLTVRKYDPEQPRDEFGKWTTGGFGAPGSSAPAFGPILEDIHNWTGLSPFATEEQAPPPYDGSEIRAALLENTPSRTAAPDYKKGAFEAGMRLLRAVADSGQAAELYRGLHIPQDSEAEKQFLALKAGDRLDLNLSSWTSREAAAEGFAIKPIEQDTPFVLHVADAHGLNIAPYSSWKREYEWITDGRFTVQSVVPRQVADDGYEMDGWQINLKQDAVFQPDASKSVATLPLSAAHFAAWLEPYLDDEPASVRKFDESEPRDEAGRWTSDGFGSGSDHSAEIARLARENEFDDALQYYKGAGYSSLNGDLRDYRGDLTRVDPGDVPYIKTLDAAFAAARPTTEAQTVWRGVKDDMTDELMGLAKGDSFVDPGYVSTSHDEHVARGYDNILKIDVPEGAKAIEMPGSTAEAEVLLPRNSEFEFLGMAKSGPPPLGGSAYSAERPDTLSNWDRPAYRFRWIGTSDPSDD